MYPLPSLAHLVTGHVFLSFIFLCVIIGTRDTVAVHRYYYYTRWATAIYFVYADWIPQNVYKIVIRPILPPRAILLKNCRACFTTRTRISRAVVTARIYARQVGLFIHYLFFLPSSSIANSVSNVVLGLCSTAIGCFVHFRHNEYVVPKRNTRVFFYDAFRRDCKFHRATRSVREYVAISAFSPRDVLTPSKITIFRSNNTKQNSLFTTARASSFG